MKYSKVMATVLLFGLVGNAHSTLFDRGGGMIYDSSLDITWLQDAGLHGPSNWHSGTAWASNLVHGSFDDWRLPVVGELQHMYSSNQVTASNSGLFVNISASTAYWSSTRYPHQPGTFDLAHTFNFSNGAAGAGHIQNNSSLRSWAVRDGDVASPVPVPAALWLLGSSVVGMLGMSRRKC